MKNKNKNPGEAAQALISFYRDEITFYYIWLEYWNTGMLREQGMFQLRISKLTYIL